MAGVGWENEGEPFWFPLFFFPAWSPVVSSVLPACVPSEVRMRLLYAGPQGRIVCRGGRWRVVQVWQVGDGEEAWDLGAVEAAGLGVAA